MDRISVNIMQGNLRPVYVYEFHKAHDLSLPLSLIQANKIWWKKLKFDPNNLQYTILLLWILTSGLVH